LQCKEPIGSIEGKDTERCLAGRVQKEEREQGGTEEIARSKKN